MSDPFLDQASTTDSTPRSVASKASPSFQAAALQPVEPGASRVPALSTGKYSDHALVSSPIDAGSAFLMADPSEASDYAVLLVIRGHGPVGSAGELAPVDRITLRNEVVGWVDVIKGRGVGDLMSATARENSVSSLVEHMLHEMVRSRSQVWSTTLPTGRQIIGAPADLVEAVGKERIVQVVHRRALQLARHAGNAHNQHALTSYEAEQHQSGVLH